MCMPATCSSCGKASYKGCGQHVEQVLAGVPKADRCSCATTGAPAGKSASESASWFGKLLGR